MATVEKATVDPDKCNHTSLSRFGGDVYCCMSCFKHFCIANVPARCSSEQQEKPPVNPEVPGTTGATSSHSGHNESHHSRQSAEMIQDAPQFHPVGVKHVWQPCCPACGQPVWFNHVCTTV